MSKVTGLPEITEEDRQFLHDNPNTDDVVDWIKEYATKAITGAVQEAVAWGIPNSRPTERNPLMQVLLDKTSCQYPELLIPLYLHPAPPATDGRVKELDPVTGDLLPKVGSRVLIHLGRQDEWVEHTVTGYYVWGDLGGNERLHRVFVRVVDDAGFPNARLLNEVRPVHAALAASKADGRPSNCRNRQRDEGKPYPKSGCESCKTGGITGCPHERKAASKGGAAS